MQHRVCIYTCLYPSPPACIPSTIEWEGKLLPMGKIFVATNIIPIRDGGRGFLYLVAIYRFTKARKLQTIAFTKFPLKNLMELRHARFHPL